MSKESFKKCQAARKVKPPSREFAIRKIPHTERTPIESAELFVFRQTEDARKKLDDSKVALKLLEAGVEKVKKDCIKSYPKISDLKEEIDSQITKGLGTIKLSSKLAELQDERKSRENWVDNQSSVLEEAKGLIIRLTKDFDDKVREAQFKRGCLGVYRQAFTNSYEEMYLAFIEARKAILAISKSFTPIDDSDISEVVNGSDWLNENHVRVKDTTAIFYGEDNARSIWEKVVDLIVEDDHRARVLNELDFPPAVKKHLPEPTGNEKPMFGRPRTLILRDSMGDYPDSEESAERILKLREEQGHSGKLADYDG